MGSIDEIMQVCRLCLVKDKVNIPIFDESNNSEEIFNKICSCLPVKVSREDNLPKKICDGCSYKLELLYTFRNTSVDSEKQLMSLLNQAGLSACSLNSTLVRDATKPEVLVKQETLEPADSRMENENSDVCPDAQSYIMQQQQLPYQQDFAFAEASGSSEVPTEEPPPKRARRSNPVKKPPVQTDSEDEDLDLAMQITKAEDEDSDDVDQPDYVEPSTSADDQPGPSGVGKDVVEAPQFPEKTLKRKLAEADLVVTNKQGQDRLKSILENGQLVYKNPFDYKFLKRRRRKSKKSSLEETNCKITKYSCMICSKVNENKTELIEHYEYHKNETESLSLGEHTSSDYFLCPVCLTEFTSLRTYEKHVEDIHGEKYFFCNECNKYFKNSYQLSIHNYKVHSTDETYRCISCDFSTKSMKSLRGHLQEKHEDEVQYKCEICHRGFKLSTSFEEHKNFHTGAMPFECEICFKSFPYTRFLLAHKRTMHPEAQLSTLPSHECETCHKRFAHKKSLVLHLKGHASENPILCEICGKCLSTSAHLKEHIRMHEGSKPYICSTCGKSFAKRTTLTVHERIHSGKKPYVCNVCDKSFSQRSTLVIHKRYHTGERPYLCHLCKRGFVAKGVLGVHLKSCKGVQ